MAAYELWLTGEPKVEASHNVLTLTKSRGNPVSELRANKGGNQGGIDE